VRLPRLLAPVCPIRAGNVDSAFEHYIRHGIDENRYSLIRREAAPLQGSIERFLVSESG
jgi:hypothetical protein